MQVKSNNYFPNSLPVPLRLKLILKILLLLLLCFHIVLQFLQVYKGQT